MPQDKSHRTCIYYKQGIALMAIPLLYIKSEHARHAQALQENNMDV